MAQGFCPVCNGHEGYDVDTIETKLCSRCGALFVMSPFGPSLKLTDAREQFPDFGQEYDVDAWTGKTVTRLPLPADAREFIETHDIIIWQAQHPMPENQIVEAILPAPQLKMKPGTPVDPNCQKGFFGGIILKGYCHWITCSGDLMLCGTRAGCPISDGRNQMVEDK